MTEERGKPFDEKILDVLFPPKQTDYAITPAVEEELDGDLSEFDGYAYNTDRQMWCCLKCGSPAFDTLVHTSWHGDLDRLLASG